MTPIFLSNRIPWFGNHTGYQQLPRYMQKLSPEMKVIGSRNSFSDLMLGKAYSLYRGWPARNQFDAAAELRFLRANSVPEPVKHVLHFENHYLFFDQWTKAPAEIISTLHVPRAEWTHPELEALKHLSSAIVLYQRDIEFFESYVGKGRVKFVPHGVDVEFFRPRTPAPEPKRLFYSGHYLRNTRMLARVLERLAEEHRGLEFHLLVPDALRSSEDYKALNGRSDIVWHQNITDDQLAALIASAYLVLLPMNDSGATTAVVEALACGTPVVTTDVGGIRDYGGGSVFPIVRNNDDDAMIELVGRYLTQPGWRENMSRRSRELAVDKFAWARVAEQHLEAYQTLAN